MIDQLVKTILTQVKEQYPGVRIPAAMRAMVTSAEKLERTYETECKIFCEEKGKTYTCKIERHFYLYAVRILDNNGGVLEEYPELIEIESRQQFEVGSVVQVAFLGNELEAAIIGG